MHEVISLLRNFRNMEIISLVIFNEIVREERWTIVNSMMYKLLGLSHAGQKYDEFARSGQVVQLTFASSIKSGVTVVKPPWNLQWKGWDAKLVKFVRYFIAHTADNAM